MAQSDPWDEEAANIQKSGHPLAATATAPDEEDYSIWNRTLNDSTGGEKSAVYNPPGKSDWQKTKDVVEGDAGVPDTGWKGQLEKFGQGAAQAITSPIMHPVKTLEGIAESTPLGMAYDAVTGKPNIGQQMGTNAVENPANALGQVAGGFAISHALGGPVPPKAAPRVPGENYTPAHHQALSAVLARGTGMGKDFIAPDVATDIGSRVRQAAANSPQKAEVIQSGTPKDALAATQSVLEDAQHQVDYEHNQARGPVANNTVDMNPVQDAIPAPKKFHSNAEGKALQTLRDRAGRVENLEDLNDFRQYLNQQTAPEYRKNAIAAGRSSVEDAALMDAATAARNHYYDSLQDATGLDFRGAKRAEGSLMKAQEALGNAAPGLVNKDTLANADKGKLETAADVAEGGSRFAHGGLPVVGYLAQKLRGTDLSQLQRQLKIGFSDLPNAQQYRGPLTSQVGRAPLKLPASVPANAPYGAPSQAAGSTGPAVPSTITPAPNQPLQLPAQAGPTGQGIPPAPQWDAPPPLNQTSRFQRTNPPLPPNPTVTPAGRNIVTPNGEVIPERPLLKAPEKPKKKNKEEDTFDGKTAAGAQVPSEVAALLHRTGAKITNNEAPTSQSVASVSPDDPNTINIDDKERFDKDKNAANQTLSHEAVHIWHNNLPPEVQKMIPMDDPKDPYHGDGYEPEELKQMRSLGVKLWNLPRERAATIIQKYAHMGGDNAPKEIKEAYGPWAKDLVDSPLSTVQQTSADQQGINTNPRPPGAMQEKHVFGEYDTGPNKGKPVPGMMERGNIDVNHRPQIHNADGSMSSIFSVTVPLDKDGSPWNGAYEKAPKYALVPSIANGKFLTPDGNIPDEHDKNAMSALEDAATDHYSKTREHLGIFSSGSAADRYAGATHAWGNDGTDSKVYAPSYAGDSNLVINPGPQTAAPTGTPGGMLSPVPSAVPVPNPMQEMKIFGEGEGKPEKEDTPNGKREVLHGSKDRDALVEEAKAEAPHLEKGLKAVADQNKGAKFDAVRGEKSEGRLTEKIKREGQPVETVPDVLAGRIAVDSDEAKDAVVADLKKHTTVVREKDEFKSGDSRFGFHAHKLQVKVSPKLSAEVQVVPKETAAQDDKQHPIYKQARTAELDGDTGKAKELASKAKEMNDGAKSRFDLRNKEKEKADAKELDSGDISKRKADADGIGRGVADHSDRRVHSVDGGGDSKDVNLLSSGKRGLGASRERRSSGTDAGDNSHKVGDRVTLPSGKSATVAYAPSKSSQLPTYRFRDEDGKTVELRARDAEANVKKAPDDVSGDIDVDLDSTLAHSDGGGARMHIGAPEQGMVDRIKKDIAAGKKVRIFTARVANDKDGKVREAIQAWSKKHLGVALDVTDKKMPGTGEILDDKAKQVKNGKVMS